MEDSTSINSIDFLSNSYHGKNFLKKINNQDRHAELFRKDLISAMKMPDSETLQPDDYLEITDSWKLEWERGVQVPVNANAFTPIIRIVSNYRENEDSDPEMFILPKKLLYSGSIIDDTFKPSMHEPYDLQKEVVSTCRYDLDELDLTWLNSFNQLQEDTGGSPLSELDTEKIMEELEVQCHNKMTEAVRTIEGLGIEYDENVVCDICRSPEGEESNEMVFCDNCDICVHQACYGIQNIPEGSWLCRTCALGIKPKCALCPMVGGAMKSTKNGDKWAHISCALWVPEVSIGCPEKMEPITNISQIPASRWALVCTLCRERSGACIQCSVRSCKTSFHVTCAFKYGLNLSTVIDDETEDVQMKAYCPKHSGVEGNIANGNSNNVGNCNINDDNDVGDNGDSGSKGRDSGSDRKSKRNKDGLTEEQRTEIRSQKLRRLAEEFYTFVDKQEASTNLDLPFQVVNAVAAYWAIKRKSWFDSALMPVKTADEDGSSVHQGEEKLIERMKMFIQLRQDLERVRNLCYMVNKREKMRRHLYRIKEEIFHRQALLYTKLIDEEGGDGDDDVPGGGSGVRGFTDGGSRSFSVKRNFHLSDSDEDDYEDEYSKNICQKKSTVLTSKGRVSKYLKINYSDDDNDDFRSDEDDYEDEDNSRLSTKKDEKKKKNNKNKEEEKAFLLMAHKSTGTIYDKPSYVLSCSFKDNNTLNNDRSFMKSAVAATARSVVDDDDDDDEIFPKSFKYDMKIDDDYLDSFCNSNSTSCGRVGTGRGRPRKIKRGRPPRVVNNIVELEEDDSDYYRRLSDEDYEEELLKFNSSKITKTQPDPAPTPAPEKKKRGRKRKSELTASAATSTAVVTDKVKSEQRHAGEVSVEPRQKRKYTKRKKTKSVAKESEIIAKNGDVSKNISFSSPGSSPGDAVVQSRSPIRVEEFNNFDISLSSDGNDVTFLHNETTKDENSDVETRKDKKINFTSGNIFADSDGDEDLDPEMKAKREIAAELLKDMEFSDSSTEEEADLKAKDTKSLEEDPPEDSILETDDIIICDIDDQEMSENIEPIVATNDVKFDDYNKNTAPNLTNDNTDSQLSINKSTLKPPSSPLFSSSEEESDDDDDDDDDLFSSNKDKNNSKVTGVINKGLLNINAKEKLLHELPIKDFIVSNQLKNMVQSFFCNLNSNIGAPKLAFNGFKLPHGKINC